jgi:RNA polymerase sigma-54 factor
LDLLTLPLLELQLAIKQELEQNPVLEKEDEDEREDLPLPEEIDNWDNYPKYSTEDSEKEERDLPIPMPKPTLKEYLLSQLRVTIKNEKSLLIGEHIIYELNEDGYLPITVEEIAKFFGEDTDIVKSVLKTIQGFDPVGVGARNLQECLLIQLKSDLNAPDIALVIIEKFFEAFVSEDYQQIKAKLQCSEVDFEEAIDCIKSYRPKPGRTWEGEVKYVVPEIVVEQDGEELLVFLTREWMPNIRLSKFYQELLHNSDNLDKEEKSYLRKKLGEAKLFLEGIEKRRETLTGIATYIIKTQLDFLSHKSNSIKFITLEEVARVINRNPSTISRAIKDKWIQTPKGVFRLKAFFSGGKIKEYPEIILKIKEVIETEDKTHPLKDPKIAEILKNEGFEIARTTVIKYRTQLGIPTANKRKKCPAPT